MNAPSTSRDRLISQPAIPWLAIARLGWVFLLFVTLRLVIQAVPLRMQELILEANGRALQELGISIQSYTSYILALNLALVAAHLIIAAIIFWRRPDDWMALLVAYALMSNGAMLPLNTIRQSGQIGPVEAVFVNMLVYLGLVTSFFLLYLFPNGRFVPGRSRYLALAWALISFPTIFFPDSPVSLLTFPLPVQLLVLAIWSFSGIMAQIYRFVNVSSPLQRQQTKWATFGLIAAVLGPFVFFLPIMLSPNLGEAGVSNMMYNRMGGWFFAAAFLLRLSGLAVTHLGMLVFPVSFAVAILRYRLWDIDILINRAVVYGLLTGLLALVYFSTIVVLQTVFRSLTGEGQNTLVTVISTLLISSLFSPFRRKIQWSIDRRFYRRRYNAQKTLARFHETIRNEVDLPSLSDKLVSVVEEAMQPGLAIIWLKEPEGRERGK